MPIRHVDTAHHVIGLPDHPHLPGRLDEIERLRRRQQLLGNTAWIAGLLGGEWKAALARERFFVGLLHLLRRPRFQHRVLAVADVQRHLAAIPVADIGMGGVCLDRAATQSRRGIKPADSERKPGELG
jgi:hypothetical protein